MSLDRCENVDSGLMSRADGDRRASTEAEYAMPPAAPENPRRTALPPSETALSLVVGLLTKEP